MTTRVSLVMMLFVIASATLRAQTSPHGRLEIPCEACHTTDSWKMRSDPSFDHSKTGFPLDGQHRIANCANCHQKLKFDGASPACATCHTDVHKSELGSNCIRCHKTQSWKITDMIQRHQLTRFPLLGRHATLECQACHISTATYQYTGAPLTCFGCHRSDFENTSSPNHKLAGFSTTCETCHKVGSFAWGSGFDHSTTSFPLTGAHLAIQCQACHSNNNYQLVFTDCYPCHTSDYQRPTNPNHVVAFLSHQCQSCHSTVAWLPSNFNHSMTKFPLTGAHTAVQCQTCHTNNNYQLVYTNCYQCHSADFAGATNPNHVSGNFSQNCQTCHTTTAWQPATFDHSTTKFALTGAHLATPCQACHTNGNYQLVYGNCYQCHSADFAGATNPNHAAGNFSQTCQTCHSTTAWQPATFDHSTTRFQLTGAHTTVQCQTCHTNGNYQLVYSGCYSCHTTDYAGTTNPNHASSGYPTACETCHTTTAWTGATFSHTKFPLTHGNSAGVCSKCHTNPANYTVFSCTTAPCHPKSNTDAQHVGRAGYVYNSANCYSCHPSGRGG